MKKIVFVALTTIIIFAMAACESSNPGQNSDAPTPTPVSTPETAEKPTSTNEPSAENAPPSEDGGISSTNILVAYFSMPEDVSIDGVDAVSSASTVVKDGDPLGNTQYLAQIIQENVGGDLFRIETVQSYPLEHAALLDSAKKEQDENVRPELSTQVEYMDSYDVIFLGYPNWWADFPQPLYTFLEEYDFSGKTIIPFCPHGGSGFSRTIATIADLQPNATVEENGFLISRNNILNAEANVTTWLTDLGYYNAGGK